GGPTGPAPATPWQSASPVWGPRSPRRGGPGAGTPAAAPGAVGPGPWVAGQGLQARAGCASAPPRVSPPPTAAPAGGLAAALAWAGAPGLGVLAALGLVPVACYSTGRRICGRSARPRTTTPAGNRVVRSGPCRYRPASGR